jgi:hypothetical protein
MARHTDRQLLVKVTATSAAEIQPLSANGGAAVRRYLVARRRGDRVHTISYGEKWRTGERRTAWARTGAPSLVSAQ